MTNESDTGDESQVVSSSGGYAYYLVRGDHDDGSYYIVGIEGQDQDAWHGFIVHATDNEKIGVGAIEWKEDIQDGWEGRYFISAKPLDQVIADAEAEYA
jgi:hypothetical protein